MAKGVGRCDRESGMINKKTAGEQLERLSGLEGFYGLVGLAMEDMVCAAQVAETQEICARAITDLLNDELRERCPTAAEVRRAMYAENERGKPDMKRLGSVAEGLLNAGGVFRPGADPSADRHLELLRKRVKEQAAGIKAENSPALREMHAIERYWGMR